MRGLRFRYVDHMQRRIVDPGEEVSASISDVIRALRNQFLNRTLPLESMEIFLNYFPEEAVSNGYVNS